MSLDIDLYMLVDTGGNTPERFELFEANYTHNAGARWSPPNGKRASEVHRPAA
mgnify:CR=1 FL=1